MLGSGSAFSGGWDPDPGFLRPHPKIRFQQYISSFSNGQSNMFLFLVEKFRKVGRGGQFDGFHTGFIGVGIGPF